MLGFSQISRVATAMLVTANDYTWLLTEPGAHFALDQADCRWPTAQCLHDAKVVHRQIIEAQLEHYWWKKTQEAEQLEREKQAKDAHDRQLAEDFLKARKWDNNEMSPPVINVNVVTNYLTHNNHPTSVNPTFSSACTAVPEIPGLNRDPLALDRPSAIESAFAAVNTPLHEASWKNMAASLFLIYCLYKMARWLCFLTWRIIKRCIFDPSPPQPDSHSRVALPIPQQYDPRVYGTRTTPSSPPPPGKHSSSPDTVPSASKSAIAGTRNNGFLTPATKGDDVESKSTDSAISSRPSYPSGQAPESPPEPSVGTNAGNLYTPVWLPPQ